MDEIIVHGTRYNSRIANMDRMMSGLFDAYLERDATLEKSSRQRREEASYRYHQRVKTAEAQIAADRKPSMKGYRVITSSGVAQIVTDAKYGVEGNVGGSFLAGIGLGLGISYDTQTHDLNFHFEFSVKMEFGADFGVSPIYSSDPNRQMGDEFRATTLSTFSVGPIAQEVIMTETVNGDRVFDFREDGLKYNRSYAVPISPESGIPSFQFGLGAVAEVKLEGTKSVSFD